MYIYTYIYYVSICMYMSVYVRIHNRQSIMYSSKWTKPWPDRGLEDSFPLKNGDFQGRPVNLPEGNHFLRGCLKACHLKHLKVSWNGGPPSYHPFLFGIFHLKKTHPAMGLSPWLWKPRILSPPASMALFTKIATVTFITPVTTTKLLILRWFGGAIR